MEENNIPFEKQIFVCTNVNQDSKHCGNDGTGEAIFREMRRVAKERGLHPRIRVAQAKCLGQCALGPNIMVYPDNTWYQGVSMDDVPSLINKYLTDK